MGKKTTEKKNACDLLDCIEKIIELSKNSKMDDTLLKSKSVKTLAKEMQLTPQQAVLFSLCIHYGPENTLMSELSKHLGVTKIAALHYSDDIDELVKKRFLRYRTRDQMSFDVPMQVINELKHNRVFTPPPTTGLDVFELFNRFNTLYNDLKMNNITPERLECDVLELLEDNSKLQFVSKVYNLPIYNEYDVLLLLMFCHYCVNDDDNNIIFSDIEDLYENASDFSQVRLAMRQGKHPLMEANLIEHVCEDGQACTSRFTLTDWAKDNLLSDFNLNKANCHVAGLIQSSTLVEKPMFYTPSLEKRVDELTNFMVNEEFQTICQRMREKGFHSGLACLFYGGPGTGKTETVYQIARQTGRSILLVDVPQIKSKWVGDSEKNIQAVFTRYRNLVKQMEVAPILLFNEADAIIGSRMHGAERAVDKMENAIQNILLQEMENMEGILIATTNLEDNLDPAFERRFLYKIRFEKPDAQVRQHIWRAMMPRLSQDDSTELARRYTFSGAQIENVARKITVYEILHGEPDNYMSMVYSYCSEELLQKGGIRQCGFI